MRVMYLLSIFIFFVLGLTVSFSLNRNNYVKTAGLMTSDTNNITPSTAVNIWPTLEPAFYPDSLVLPKTNRNSKLSIEEIEKIVPDKNTAETGEDVRFTVTLKNKGDRKKLLTHLCFSDNKGTTSGCVLNHNLEAGEQISLNNTMRFLTPGTYKVWVIWSQDKTNFYRPHKSGTAVISIY